MIDLSGVVTSADSLTRLMANLAAEYVDFQFDPISSVALGFTVLSEGFDCSSGPVPTTDCMGLRAALSALRERTVNEISQVRSFTYCWIPGFVRSKEQMSAGSRIRF